LAILESFSLENISKKRLINFCIKDGPSLDSNLVGDGKQGPTHNFFILGYLQNSSWLY
jgi:hypothetical protein